MNTLCLLTPFAQSGWTVRKNPPHPADEKRKKGGGGGGLIPQCIYTSTQLYLRRECERQVIRKNATLKMQTIFWNEKNYFNGFSFRFRL